jgi:DNA-binding Lrp family transcriptional regulator
MAKTREKTKKIQDFILENVEEHPQSIVSLAVKEFGLSRQAIHKHVKKMVDDGLLDYEGATRNRKYSLAILEDISWEFDLEDLEEDKVWRKKILPLLAGVSKNVLDIFDYGVTKMVNNAIDHSEGNKLLVVFQRTAMWVSVIILDDGVGIFNKIQNQLGLDDTRHAILELSKGKLTTDPKRHSGEGVFFTSRMFDRFTILSGKLYFSHTSQANTFDGTDWLLQDVEALLQGTSIELKINLNSTRTVKDVFDYYTSADDYGFDKTIVPVSLARYGNENLISRSQAKRLLARFEKFKEIVLDFQNVDMIGQAFADEVFRVFQNAHPEIKIYPFNTNEQVEKMISRAKNV